MRIRSSSRLPQGDRVAIGIESRHTHSERIRRRLRLDEFDTTRFELVKILSKIIRLDEEGTDPRRGLCLAGVTGPKQDFESLILKGDPATSDVTHARRKSSELQPRTPYQAFRFGRI
jgi:hypothetical protein